MRVLIVDDAGEGALDLALRAQRDGHQVRVFTRRYDPVKRPVGKGLVERVPDWRAHVDWCDLIILPVNNFYMSQMDALRARGVKIIGGGVESASWERERLKGMAILKRCGIPVPPSVEFRDYDAAIKHVEKTGESYASKPCWDEDDKGLSYVADSPEGLIYMLRKWKRKHGRPKGPFILQEKIKGIEFAVGGWFGPGGWAGGWEENWEEKKLMTGGLGPNTGETGTTLRYVRSSKLADKLLRPLEAELQRIGYVGCIDVNAIVDEDGAPWPLEFTNRFGWPAWNISMALLKDDPIDFFMALAEGETPSPFRLNEVAVGVVVAQGDFPHSKIPREEVVGIPIWGANAEDERLHPCEIMAGEKGVSDWAAAGDYLLVGTGTGNTVQEARQGAYRAVKRLEIPNSPFWRTDIGSRLARQLPALQQHGYARGLSYS